MGVKYLWDTNTVIYFLQNQFPPSAESFVDNTLSISPPAISAITEIELLCWKTPTEKELKILHHFIEDATVYELEKSIKLKTAEIPKAQNTKLPDAIIAAAAIIYELVLLTRNTKDFKLIEGLEMINPFET